MDRQRTPDIMTPEQAAAYLQVNREAVYRYIREGKLVASKLGRTYRISRRALDLMLWASRTRQDVALREYSGEQIETFLDMDRLDEQAQAIRARFGEVMSARSEDALPSGASR